MTGSKPRGPGRTKYLIVSALLLLFFPFFASAMFTRQLGPGSVGTDVQELQQFLKDRSFFPLDTTTTFFGQVTQDSVAKFQASVGLEAVGQVGPKTLAFLNGSANTTTASATSERPFSLGMMGEEVSALQQLLKDHGFYTYPTITGYFGPITQAALSAYLTAHNLESVRDGGAGTSSSVAGGVGADSTTNPNPIAPIPAPIPSPTPISTAAATPAPIPTPTPIIIPTPTPPTQIAAPSLSLSVDKTSVTSGESTTVTWSSANASSCTASGGWTGEQGVSGSKTFANLTSSNTYTLSCTGTGGTVSSTVSVAVTAVPVVVSAVPPAPMPDMPAPSSPSTPAPLGGYVVSPTLSGAAELVADFPIEQGLGKSWGTGAIPGLYGGGEGAFRLTCGAEGPLRYDDPLVYPGQPGKSHLHLFWGPMDIDANTTMDSLAASVGNSNCNYGPNTLNRSAYWAPALLDDAGYVRNADWIAVYYKEPMASSARCTPGSSTFEGTCVGLPNRLRMVFGWNASKPDEKVQGSSWYCTGGTGGHYSNLDDIFQSGCKAGDTLVADLTAPNCWDGTYLDSPDHRSHLAYAGYGSWGYLKCPATHPYVIPQNESKIAWTVTADMYETLPDGTIHSRLHLASDHMKSGAKSGETIHSDYMEEWVGAAKKMWQDNCINKGLSCSGGDLGNGLQLKGASQPSYGFVNPNPKSATPMEDMMPSMSMQNQAGVAAVAGAVQGESESLQGERGNILMELIHQIIDFVWNILRKLL